MQAGRVLPPTRWANPPRPRVGPQNQPALVKQAYAASPQEPAAPQRPQIERRRRRLSTLAGVAVHLCIATNGRRRIHSSPICLLSPSLLSPVSGPPTPSSGTAESVARLVVMARVRGLARRLLQQQEWAPVQVKQLHKEAGRWL
ncbi:unnamed protein product [Urochloa humidicola]